MYMGNGRTQDDFTAYLFCAIAEEIQIAIPGLIENPVCNKSPSALRALYSGTSTLTHKDASWLLCHLDKEKFINDLKQLPLDTITLMAQELEECIHEVIPVYKAEEYIANLFVQIIRGTFKETFV